MKKFLIPTLSLLILTAPVLAAEPKECDLATGTDCVEGGSKNAKLLIEEQYIPEPLPNAAGGALFMKVKNLSDQPQHITHITSPAAEKIELHTITTDGDIMQMRQVETYDIPAGDEIVLEPTGHHVMLMGLSDSLTAGETVWMRVDLEGGEHYMLNVPVRAREVSSDNQPSEPVHIHEEHTDH